MCTPYLSYAVETCSLLSREEQFFEFTVTRSLEKTSALAQQPSSLIA